MTPLKVGTVLAPTRTSAGGAEAAVPILRERLARFCSAITAGCALPTEPRDFDDYPSLLEAMASGDLDLAWLPPIVAMRAAAAGRALPIALPVRRGVSSFHSALFTVVGSPVQRPPDLNGARVAWVDRQSASGYLLIRAALRAQGVRLDQAFAEEHFFGSHEAVVRAVLDGTADVGATFLHHDATGSGVWRAGWGDASVHIVARVGPIPSDVIAAGIHVPVSELRTVQRALTDGAHAELVAAGAALMEAEGFVVAASDHLKTLEDLLDFLEDAARPWQSMLPPPNARRFERGD
ncbi:MAG: PhnD/SsuA/transferrin family substrate-binding protein [Polyangiaceae bacterium]|nr:PhnD/SsuA/transferrin family substrate-binding protein [Polyangiaceae bacterium]